MGRKMLGDRLLQELTLSFESLDARGKGTLDDARAATNTRLLISVLLPAEIALQVIQPCEKGLQLDQRLGGWRPCFWSGQAAVTRQEHRIDPVRLAQNSHASGETADLRRIDERNRHTFGRGTASTKVYIGVLPKHHRP